MRVLIVDDHPIVISGCRALLGAESGCELRAAGDAAQGEAVYFDWRPDVTVIDDSLPSLSGLDLCRRLRARDAGARLVLFSAADDPALAARAIEAGARGCVAKTDDPQCLVEAVRQVARGGAYLPPELARRIAFLRPPARTPGLSARDQEILRQLAAGRSLGDIADALHVSCKTVANNCTSLKRKLGARSSMDLMRAALKRSGG